MDKSKKLMDPDDALEVIVSSVPVLSTEAVQLGHSLDRVAAEDLYAGHDLPVFDNSAMDGYAVLAKCTRGATATLPNRLRVIASRPAGADTPGWVTPGTAIRVMTGATMPRGADAVIRIEDTELQQDCVSVFRELAAGENVRRAGEDVVDGDLVVRSGSRIGPAQMGMLAALGKTSVPVYARPRAAVVTTGSELVDASESLPLPGRIRDSNMHSLAGQVLRSGAEVSLVARVGDDRGSLAQVLREAADVSDMVITSGGVSVGDYDLVKETLSELGDMRFWGVAIKPGKLLAYGSIQGRPFFGLPGNPVSSMVTFEVFVRPALRRMAGLEDIRRAMVSGVISRHVMHSPGWSEYIRCRLIWRDSGYVATPTGDQGSGRLSSMLEADAYVVIPKDVGDVMAGTVVDIMVMD